MIDPNKEAYLAIQAIDTAISHLEQAVKVDEDFVESRNLSYALYNAITNASVKRH